MNKNNLKEKQGKKISFPPCFLNNYPAKEKLARLDENHVIINRNDWLLAKGFVKKIVEIHNL